MEPLIIIILPGLLGGVVLALLFSRFRGESGIALGDPRLEPPTTNLINMAHIRVAGVGGLGMVAMAITVAIFLPRIRLTMAIAVVLGAALAAVLIALRRRQGPLPSSNQPGAHAMFSIETPPRAAPNEHDSASRDRSQDLVAVPAP
jgi:hypothetical protein